MSVRERQSERKCGREGERKCGREGERKCGREGERKCGREGLFGGVKATKEVGNGPKLPQEERRALRRNPKMTHMR